MECSKRKTEGWCRFRGQSESMKYREFRCFGDEGWISPYDILPIGISKEGKWYIFEGDLSKIEDGGWQQRQYQLLPPNTDYKCIITLENGCNQI